MQLVPQKMPEPRLLMSMDAEETGSGVGTHGSAASPKRAVASSSRRRWFYLGSFFGALVFALIALAFNHRNSAGNHFGFPTFIKARTSQLSDSASGEPPAPIVVQLSADMVRVSAISLGHPRLAIINGTSVTEGDRVTLQKPNSSVALVLSVAKIADGSIELTDGKQMFSARLTIPSPPKPTNPL